MNRPFATRLEPAASLRQPQQGTPTPVARTVGRRLLPISVAFLATLAYFHAVGLHPQYMRAESGWFLATAASGAGAMGVLFAGFFTHSYSGHYTPIALGLELLQSAIFGPHEWIWLTRQALVFAVLGVAFFRLMRAMLPVPIALAATIVFMVQPFMLDAASWPAMVMHFGYLILFAVTAYLLIKFARQPKSATLWWTVSCGYAPMHVFGTGLATALSLEGCLIGLYLAARSRGPLTILRRHLVWAIGVLGALTLVHGALMACLPDGNPPETVRVGLLVSFERFGGLLADTLWAALRAMWAPDAFPWPRVDAIATDAAYGFGVVAILIAIGVHLANRYRHEGTPDRLAQILAYSFAAGTLLFIVALMVMRGGPDDALLGFLIGGRYLIFISMPALVVFASLAMRLTWPTGMTRAISAAVIVTSLWATFVFVRSVKPKIWPRQSISDDRVIAASTAYIETAVATHSPVEDVDMSPVTEFPFGLKWYAPIIRKQIGLAPSVDLTWGISTNPAMTRARDAVLDALR